MREPIAQLAQWLLSVDQEVQSPGSTDLPRYLAVSDLHGNGHRLGEVLAVAERENVEHIYLVGDIYSGPGGWALYRGLRERLAADPGLANRITLQWGNHELAFVAGMLGNDKQLRFFYNYGGRDLLQELNDERQRRGEPCVNMSGSPRLSDDDRATLRGIPEFREMARWIQQTHRIFAVDRYGTGYLHAFPKINRHGRFVFQYHGMQGLESLQFVDQDLSTAEDAGHPVFSMLLQTETSPLWALFEIHSARQFDQAARAFGVRRIVFGHRHQSRAVNVGRLNRQFGIAVDFDRGLGGYLMVGPQGLEFRRFVEPDSHRTESLELVEPVGRLDARVTYLHDLEEFLFSRLLHLEQEQFDQWPVHSTQARREFEAWEGIRQRGFRWIHRLYAELYPHVKDPELQKEMFSVAVASGDEEAFRSFIHLLYRKTLELESCGNDWFNEKYVRAKTLLQIVMNALRDMPVARLGLLDIPLRGTTSRFNLTELYKRVLKLEDPELAVLAVQNLGTLRTPEADQELRLAFFHDVRKVRLQASQTLADHGDIAYPLVSSLLRYPDIWVRCLVFWTLAELSHSGPVRQQAIADIRRALRHESDWFLYMVGKELLRKLRDPDVDNLPDRPEIPNLSDAIVATLQEIVDCEQEPFRRAFKVFYITLELSSIVYRRGLIGLDVDDLRIYVNDADYFPPYYRTYKAGDRDMNGRWRGWRRLWIRGETPNLPDGPQIVELERGHDHEQNLKIDELTIVVYDHRTSEGRVQLPPFEQLVERYGLGKIKDRVRHALLDEWPTFSRDEQVMLGRIHAAAVLKMLFDLPAEVWVAPSEWGVVERLSERMLQAQPTPRHVLKLAEGDAGPPYASSRVTALPQWLDVPKYTVTLVRQGS